VPQVKRVHRRGVDEVVGNQDDRAAHRETQPS
jgi:hypothetical protein